MMKIAIWGYGKYGRRMFESLTRFCSEDYEIVRIYDAAYQTLKYTEGEKPLKIHSPEELPEDYKNGLFEKVLLCIFFYDPRLKTQQRFLREHSIPELHLGRPDDLYPISSFEQGEKTFELNRAGYKLYIIKNLYSALANYETFEMFYLFDKEGKVVEEHKDRFDPARLSVYFYDYPFVFKRSKAEKVFLAGQYCVLTRKHSGNYWHFTYNNLDVVWLLEQAGYRGKYVVPNAKCCSEILHMLDIPSERIVTISEFEHNKIYVLEEVFYIVLNGAHEIYSTPVLLEAAEYIKKKLPVNPELPKKLYVKRIGKRKLLDADEVLAEYGFITMIPEDYSVKEQMTLFYNADVVFCVHGANSTNCLYMRKNTIFIEAFSSYWENRCNLYTIAETGINYLPVSSLETVSINKDGVSRDYAIPDVLLRMTIQNAFLISQAKYSLLSTKSS